MSNKVSDLLVKLLLGDRNSVKAAAEALTQEELWHEAVGMAGLWRVTPQLRKQVNAFSLAVDAAAKQQLKRESIATAVQSTKIAHQTGIVLNQLNQAGVRAIAFKGIGLLGNLYKAASDRMVYDADLLIDRDDLAPTYKILSSLGFSTSDSDECFPPGFSSQWQDRVDYLEHRDFAENLSIALVNQEGFAIDLHWKLVSASPEQMASRGLIDRAQVVTMYGIPVHVAAPSDAMMLTVHHAVRQSFAPWTTVKDLCDLAAWWTVQPERWQIKDVIKHAELSGLSKPLLALWQLLAYFNPESPAQEGIAQLAVSISARGKKEADGLEELFKLRLREGNVYVNTDLRYTASLSFIKEFIVNRLKKHTTDSSWKLYKRTDLKRVHRLILDAMFLKPHQKDAYRALVQVRKDSGLNHFFR